MLFFQLLTPPKDYVKKIVWGQANIKDKTLFPDRQNTIYTFPC